MAVRKLRVCVEIIWWCMCSMFIDDHSELNFRGIIIKGCGDNILEHTLWASVVRKEAAARERKLRQSRTLGRPWESWREHYVIQNCCGLGRTPMNS
jgi:hypothetical protein